MMTNQNMFHSKCNIKIAHWNMEGMRLSGSYPKTEDPKFLEIVKQHDIICLTETHCGEEQKITIHGYRCFQICRAKSKKSKRYHGGIAVLYKESLKPGLKFLQHKNNDYAWIKLSKHFFNISKDTYMCVAYIPPENSPVYKARGQNTLEFIEKDIMYYYNLGSVILVGDLNARTGTELDFIENDVEKHQTDNNEFYILDKNIVQRNSEDKTLCKRGKTLIELCNTAQIRIINGRCIGDIQGQFTCFKYNGSSVVDYLITDETNMKNIKYFEVLNFIGDLSDHCCLSFALKCNYTELLKLSQYNVTAFPATFKWDSSCISAFQTALTEPRITGMINKFMSIPSLNQDNITEAVNDVTNIYIESAKCCLKTKPRKLHTSKHIPKHKPWFNNDLKRMRLELDKIGKILHCNSRIPEIRRVFFKTLKMYNKKRKITHRQYTQTLMNQLNNLRSSDPQAYWKLLKTMNNDISNPSVNIKLQEWELYFKDLNSHDLTHDNKDIMQKIENLERIECFNEMDFRFTEKEITKCINRLKNNKSSGFDGVRNEMLKYSQHIM